MITYLNQLRRKITPWEKKRLWLIILFVVIMTTVPHIYGYFNTPEQNYYTGLFWPSDGNLQVYLNYITQVEKGNILLENFFTSEPQTASMFQPLWVFLGILVRYLEIPRLLIFHLARILLGVFLLWFSYLFLTFLFKEDRNKRLISFLFLSLSGGFVTWLFESNTFLAIFLSPLLVLSLILILAVLFLYLIFVEKKEFNKTVWWAGFLALILGFSHPYDLVTLYFVLGVAILVFYLLYKKNFWLQIKWYLVVVLISSFSLYYYQYIFGKEQAIGVWATQNVTTSPSPDFYLLSFGLLSPLAFVGIAYFLLREKIKKFNFVFLIVWTLTQLVLLYFPLPFNRRLVLGVHIPISIWATLGTLDSWSFLKKRKVYLRTTLLLLALATLLSYNFYVIANNFRIYYLEKTPYYLPLTFLEPAVWLDENSSSQSVILSSYKWNTFISGQSNRKVFIGSEHNTIYWDAKVKEVEWFFKNDWEKISRYDFLKNNNIDYIYYSLLEKQLGDYNPETKTYLDKVYDNTEVSIYKVL